MQRLEAVSRAALAAPRFLMSSPAGLQGFEPEQYYEKATARKEWDSLKTTLTALGAEVEVFNRKEFTSPAVSEVGTAAFIRDGTAFVPKEKNLRGIVRRQFIDAWAQKRGYRLQHMNGVSSARDMVKIGDLVLTQNDNCPHPREIGAPVFAVETKKIHHRLSRLDTVLCPLDDTSALIVKEAFDDETFAMLASRMTLIEVPLSEALQFACNSIVLGHNVVINHDCQITAQKLRDAGFCPVFVDLSTFRGGPLKYALRIA